VYEIIPWEGDSVEYNGGIDKPGLEFENILMFEIECGVWGWLAFWINPFFREKLLL